MSNFPDRSTSDSAVITTDINNLAQGVPTYESTRTYDADRIIEYLGVQYKSLVGSNQGNTPSSSPTEWELAGGAGITSYSFTLKGSQIVSENLIEFMIPDDLSVSDVFIKVNTAPTGADLEVDINKNGTTIFTTQSNRPIISAGSTDDTSGTPDITSFSQDDILGISVDQVGSTVAGTDLFIRVNLS